MVVVVVVFLVKECALSQENGRSFLVIPPAMTDLPNVT